MFHKVSNHPTLPGNDAVYASKVIPKGIQVFDLTQLPEIPENNKYAITFDAQKNIYLDTVGTDIRLLNHSCDPNLEFNGKTKKFIAIRDIKEDQMLTFDYLTTEPHMQEAFNCACGAPTCKGYINGSLN